MWVKLYWQRCGKIVAKGTPQEVAANKDSFFNEVSKNSHSSFVFLNEITSSLYCFPDEITSSLFYLLGVIEI